MCTQLRVEMRELRWCPEIVPAPWIQLAADAVLASYFAPGPEPRYDTPQARAEAEAEAGL